MTEDDARLWLIETLAASPDTMSKLETFRSMVMADSDHQNLIARSTMDVFWTRHVADSAQLLLHAEHAPAGDWLDLGSGAGLPGIIIAALCPERTVHLVEERRGRIGFLTRVVAALGLENAQVHGCKVEALRLEPVAVITARAFAPLPKLLALGHRFSRRKTLWLLPKGRSAREEVDNVRGTWQGMFHVKQSITDAEAAILVVSGVRKVAGA